MWIGGERHRMICSRKLLWKASCGVERFWEMHRGLGSVIDQVAASPGGLLGSIIYQNLITPRKTQPISSNRVTVPLTIRIPCTPTKDILLLPPPPSLLLHNHIPSPSLPSLLFPLQTIPPHWINKLTEKEALTAVSAPRERS